MALIARPYAGDTDLAHIAQLVRTAHQIVRQGKWVTEP